MTPDADFVFILGAARSGTKLLRDLLGESGAVRTVPFDVNYVWRHGNEMHPDDALPPELATQPVRHYIGHKLAAMARAHSRRETGLIVEKTVSNTLRVPFLHRLFPSARFVHLIRDGRDVAESAARMWRAPVGYRYLLRKIRYFPFGDVRYALWFLRNRLAGRRRGPAVWGPRYPGIEEDAASLPLAAVTARQWLWSVESTLSGLARVPAGQCFTVFYEELTRDPLVLEKLLEFLVIPDSERVLAAHRNRVTAGSVGKWRELGLEEQQVVLDIQAPMLKRLGYLQ